MFPAAVVDADLRLVLRLTSYIGTRPVQRHELCDVTTDVGDFRIKIPVDLPMVEESWRSAPRACFISSWGCLAPLDARRIGLG